MELLGFHDYMLIAKGTKAQLQEAQAETKSKAKLSAFWLTVALVGGSVIAYQGGNLIVDNEGDKQGRKDGLSVIFGTALLLGGVSTVIGGGALAGKALADDVARLKKVNAALIKREEADLKPVL